MPTVSEIISQILLKKLREEGLTPQEAATLAEWESRSPDHAAFIALLMNEDLLTEKIKGMLEQDEQPAWERIEKAIETERTERDLSSPVKLRWYRYVAAACVILILGVAGYFIVTSKPSGTGTADSTKPATLAEIAPGRNRAILTLMDGSVIRLDNAANGLLADQAGSKAVKTEDGILVYQKSNTNRLTGDASHVLSTPKGGQYQVELPDGSKVWLNASSFIKFPTVFAADERRVEFNGEAYFEVAKDARRKFIAIVKSAHGHERQVVEVLGTHFNITAYEDEKTITTSLLEGKIKIAKPSDSGHPSDYKTLQPGQQASLTEGTISVSEPEEITAAVAWKNGFFDASNVDIKVLMRQIARWYDIQVEYQGEINAPAFGGKIPRSYTLSRVLKGLQINTGLTFRLEDKKVIVSR